MTDAIADTPSATATADPSPALRLRRGWLAGCTEQNHLTRFHRDRFPECCHNGGRTWFLSEGETFLAAVFDLATAKRIRDAVNQCAGLLSVNGMCARVCEEHPSSVEVGMFRADEFVHLTELEPSPALELLVSLLESFEALTKDPANADLIAKLDQPLFFGGLSRVLKPSPESEATLTRRPTLHEIRAVAPLSLTLRMLLLYQCFEDTPTEFLCRVLIDVRHFCDAYALELGKLDRAAHVRYLQERQQAIDQLPDPEIPPVAMRIPSGLWKDISEQQDHSILLTTVLIHGVPHHLKAIEVQMRESLQRAVNPSAEQELSDVHAACAASGPFETVRLSGREYVMTLTPHSR